jgi:hypothetical protein
MIFGGFRRAIVFTKNDIVNIQLVCIKIGVFAVLLLFTFKKSAFYRSIFFQHKIGIFAVQLVCKKLAFLLFNWFAKIWCYCSSIVFYMKNRLFYHQIFLKIWAFSPHNGFAKIGVFAVQLVCKKLVF